MAEPEVDRVEWARLQISQRYHDDIKPILDRAAADLKRLAPEVLPQQALTLKSEILCRALVASTAEALDAVKPLVGAETIAGETAVKQSNRRAEYRHLMNRAVLQHLHGWRTLVQELVEEGAHRWLQRKASILMREADNDASR